MYDVAALESAFAQSTYAGKFHYTAITGSTNTDAVAAARSGAPHGSVFFTDEQTAGRGRGDHGWHSAAGQGLYVSVLLRPSIGIQHMRLIPLVAGLAAAQAIGITAGREVDLRWPNDLLIGERKVGGILVESKTESGTPSFAVVGIGINVHQRSFDPGLSTPATSLDIEAGRVINRQVLLISLLESLQHETWALQDPGLRAAITARVAYMSSWISNRRVEVHGPQACIGTTAGLDEHGFLLVRTDQGIVTVQTGGIRAAN
ncbi:biotin--[acetyl-CoA-carboxylase] ligase [Occallatibacter savannae]|uniref:biotin--[acetyl-CoA-carboxylase] ligase n=1 Tax=Occallatibacter savannae TaxID=1002691 RepID=UPI0013A53DDE|nr:biotin--[acetyl-CoA-carboxylase] ligase [Occallatibacter savannae]